MSAKKMTQEERKMSQAIMKNLQKLMQDRHITKHKEVYDHIPAFTQSQFSNVINGNNFPTMMQLIGLADFFNVSIDFLLNRNIPNLKEKMNVVDCCSCIAKMIESDNNIKFEKITVKETDTTEETRLIDLEPGFYTEIVSKEEERNYYAFYFSAVSNNNNENHPDCNAKIINTFIENLIKINPLYKDGTLTKDMYDALLSKFLNDVQEENKDPLKYVPRD